MACTDYLKSRGERKKGHIQHILATEERVLWLPRGHFSTCFGSQEGTLACGFGSQESSLSCFNQPRGQSSGFCQPRGHFSGVLAPKRALKCALWFPKGHFSAFFINWHTAAMVIHCFEHEFDRWPNLTYYTFKILFSYARKYIFQSCKNRLIDQSLQPCIEPKAFF